MSYSSGSSVGGHMTLYPAIIDFPTSGIKATEFKCFFV